MSVALPPPLPPEQSDAAALRRTEELGIAQVGTYRLHLLGNACSDMGDWRAIAARSETPSDAVRALSKACRNAGYLSVQLYYALDGEDLYVLLDPGALADVRASPPLSRYVGDLPTGEPLRDRVLEPRRLLAEAHADRAGLDAAMTLRPQATGQVLKVDVFGEPSSATRFGIEFSNPGNRFVGRNFVDFEAVHSRPSGDRVGVRWNLGLEGLDDDDSVDRYSAETLTWTRITPRGLVGLTAQLVDYRSRATEQDIEGDLTQVAARWAYPLAATLWSRWIIESQLDYADNRKSGVADQDQEERNASAEPGLVFVHHAQWMDRDWTLEAGMSLRKGLGSGQSARSPGQRDYLTWRPHARLNLAFDDRTRGGISLLTQLTSDTVPEQEQWVLGGRNALSAYLPGVAVGDGGAVIVLQVESRVLENTGMDLRPRVFAEYGLAHVVEPVDGADEVELADVGIELNARLSSHLEATIGVATSVLDDDLDAERRRATDAGVLFRLAGSF